MIPLISHAKHIPIPKSKLVVAVSGGADSMLLLDICAHSDTETVAVHVNYGKRGIESDADEKLVRDYCKENGIPVFVKQFDSTTKGNFQSLAREFRYAFFEDVRKATSSEFILTAHHKNDDDESLLFQLLRGGNVFSLTGIPEQRGKIRRPLIKLTKQQIIEMARSRGLVWREDHTNLENDYRRNEIRNLLIPRLDRENPGWRNKLYGLRKTSELVSNAIDELMGELTVGLGNQLDRKRWLSLGPGLKKIVLSKWIQSQTEEFPAENWLAMIDKLADLQTGASLDVQSGWYVIRDRDIFTIHNRVVQSAEDCEALRLNLEEMRQGAHHQTAIGTISLSRGQWLGRPVTGVLELCLESVRFPITIRKWKAGDRIKPYSLQGTKLISDLLTDYKISTTEKPDIPIVESFDGKICAVIFSAGERKQPGIISQQFSCTDAGQETLTIAIKKKL
ncbi:MAG: tRNA lysidine(34) synthetase TilS [Balneolia bacterium]|nr:tRNA lysidine(34) synthetase TilS [Balneolia bacterium]